MSPSFDLSHAIRPLANWARDIEATGFVLMSEGREAHVGMYAVLSGDLAVMVTPAADGYWRLDEVPYRERAVLAARHEDRKLIFPSEPESVLAQTAGTLQTLDPARVNLVYAGTNGKQLRRARGRLQPGDWDLEVGAQPLTDTAWYRVFEARFSGQRGWGDISDGEALARPPHSDDGKPVDPRTLSDAQAVAERAYAAVSAIGDPHAPESWAAAGAQINVAINREGRYILLDGAPWLASARLLSLPSVPVNVVARHPDWETVRERIIGFAGTHKGRVYQRVQHADLYDLRAHHDDDRLPLIRAGLEGYERAGKRLVDIGAHWGQMSLAMEDQGFQVTAVEANSKSAGMAARLKVATEASFEVWEGSIFEYPEIAKFDVVLGLNIFHHFIKEQEMFEDLVALLERLEADIVIFAAHVDRGPDMRTAYRNFAPEEFAEFVSHHTGLPDVTFLGHTHDGRTLYKIAGPNS